MNNQEAFDKALFGIRAQQYRVALGADMCAYYVHVARCGVEQGDRCGVGHIMSEAVAKRALHGINSIMYLSDESFAENFGEVKYGPTGQPFREIPEWRALVQAELAGLAVGMLDEIQNTHDGALRYHGADAFEAKMRDLADKYGVVYTPVPELTE